MAIKYNKKDLIDNIKELRKKLGRVPNERDLTSPCIHPYIRQFGSWNDAIREAGMEIPSKGSEKNYSEEYLINLLKKRHKQTGKTPTQREFETLKDFPDPTTYYSYFGSWNNAIKAAGIKLKRVSPSIKKDISKKSEPEVKKPKRKSWFKRLFG